MDGRQLTYLAPDRDGDTPVIRTVDLDTGKVLRTVSLKSEEPGLMGRSSEVVMPGRIQHSPRASQVAFAWNPQPGGGYLCVINYETGELWVKPAEGWAAADFSPEGHLLAVTRLNGWDDLTIFDSATLEPVLAGLNSPYGTHVICFPNNSELSSVSLFGILQRLDFASNEDADVIDTGLRMVLDMAVSLDLKTMAIWSASKHGVESWNLELAKPSVVLSANQEMGNLQFSPSGKYLAALPRITHRPGSEFPVYLWHAPSLKELDQERQSTP